MKQKTIIIWVVIAALVLIFVVSPIVTYNGLVTKRQAVTAAMSDISTQLQRRNDLIPNLVSTVKGYAAQEKSIFEDVSANQAKLAGASTLADQAAASDQLSSSLSRLIAIQINFPELKSNANFQALSDELAGTENRIAVSRLDYNNAVQTYDTSIQSFPNNMLAGMFGFKAAQYFQASSNATTPPDLSSAFS